MMRFFEKTLFISGIFMLLFFGSTTLLTSAQTANTSCSAGQFWLQCGASGGCAPAGSVCPATTNTDSTNTGSISGSNCPAGQVQCPAIGSSPAGCYTTCPTASGTGSTGSLQCISPQIRCWNGTADYCYSPTAIEPHCPMNCGTGMKKMNCPDVLGKIVEMCVSESNPTCPSMTGSTGTGGTTSCQSPMVSCHAAGNMPAGCYEKCAPTAACSNGSWWWDSNNHDWKCGTTGTGGTGTGTMTEEQKKTECAKWTDMKWCPSTDAAMQGMCVKNTDACCTSGQKFCWDDTNKKNYCYVPTAAQPSCPASTGTGDTTSEWDKCKTTGGSWCPATTTNKAYCAAKGSKCECPSGMSWDDQSMACKTSQTQTCSDDAFWCPWSMNSSGGECKKNGTACWTYNPPTCGKGYIACKNNEHSSYECYAGTSCPDLSKTTPEQRCKAKNAPGGNRWQWCAYKNFSGAGGSDGNCADTSDKCMMPCNQHMCEARSKEKGNESMEWCSDTYKMRDGKTETSEWCSPSGCPVKKKALCLSKGREWCEMEDDMPAMAIMNDPDQENGWCATKNESCPFHWPYRKDTCEKYQGKWCQYDRNWGECVPGNRTCDEFDFSQGKCMWGKNATGECNAFPDTESKCESPEMNGYWCKQTMNYTPVMCGPQLMAATAMPVMPTGVCNKLPICPSKPTDGMRVCPDGKKYAISKLSKCPSLASVEEPKKEKQCSGGKQALSDGTCPVEKRKLEEPEKLKPEEVLTPEERASRESNRSTILKELEDAAAELRGKRDSEGYTIAQKAVNELKGYQNKLHSFTKDVVDSYKEVLTILKARGAKIEKDGSVETAQKLLEDLKVGQLNKIKLDFVDTEKFIDTLEEKIATLKEAGLPVSGILESIIKESKIFLESVMSASSYSEDVQRQSDALTANLLTINNRYLSTINTSFKVKNAAELLNERLNTLAEEAATLKEFLSEKKYDVSVNIAAINTQISTAKSELATNMKSAIGSSTLNFLKTFTESRFRDIEDELADTGSVEDLSLMLYGDDGKEDALGGVAGRFALYTSKVAAMKASEKSLKGKQRSAALRARTTLETEIKRARTPYNQLKSLEKKEDALTQKQRVSVVKTANTLNNFLDKLNSKLKLQNEASIYGTFEDILEKNEIEPVNVKEVKESIKASKDISRALGFDTAPRYIVKK